MGRLRLIRPLAVFDLETTGTDPAKDRIVEISILVIAPDGGRLVRTRRLNPEMPIPSEATAVHGIGDDDVRDAPTFRQVARSLLEVLEGADLAGFNVRRFDIPILDREFRDSGFDLRLPERNVVDAMTLFHRKEPRDLSAAVRFYLDRDHAGAHGAEADVLATAEVLEAQIARYDDVPETPEEIDAWLHPVPPGAVDRSGKFVLREGEVVFGFGKHQGRPLREVARRQRDYLEWLLRQNFPDDARSLIEEALRRR